MIKDILVSVVRQLLAFVCGVMTQWLSENGIVTKTQMGILLGVLAGIIVNLLWAVGERLIRRWGLETAFHLTPQEGIEGLREISNTTPLSEKLAVGVSQLKN